jgi:hypothetical protein
VPGKKRAPQRSQEQASAQRTESGAELAEQQAIGNQALGAQAAAEREGQGSTTEAADIEAVRAEALPMVERAMVALYTEPRSPARIEKFVRVLESSRLPADRKAVLVDKLVSEQDAALAVEAAAERWFGSAELDVRTEALGALDRVWGALSEGPLEAEPAGSSIGERADALMGDLARERVGEEMGEAIQGFCREVYLILAWHQDEEEEEEEGFAPSPEAEIDG